MIPHTPSFCRFLMRVSLVFSFFFPVFSSFFLFFPLQADEGMLEKHLPQDPIYILHSALKPKEFDFHCTIPHDRAAPLPNGGQRFVADEDASPEGSKGRFEVAILEKETNHVHQIRAKMVPIEQVQARLKSSFKGTRLAIVHKICCFEVCRQRKGGRSSQRL